MKTIKRIVRYWHKKVAGFYPRIDEPRAGVFITGYISVRIKGATLDLEGDTPNPYVRALDKLAEEAKPVLESEYEDYISELLDYIKKQDIRVDYVYAVEYATYGIYVITASGLEFFAVGKRFI
ncbi:MAG: hypothetical protein KatS3mg031_2848 [Chitinophagales bacterium]|nr:MAG: hypothetical protein KatS3mg031_2848 [Chitinophagales bacterium]